MYVMNPDIRDICTASTQSFRTCLSELTTVKNIGQTIVNTKKIMTVASLGPRYNVAIGKVADVGRLCRTSKAGSATFERGP
jgi:hypothetical protein